MRSATAAAATSAAATNLLAMSERVKGRGGAAVKPTRVVLHLAYLTHLMKNQQDISIYDGAVPVL